MSLIASGLLMTGIFLQQAAWPSPMADAAFGNTSPISDGRIADASTLYREAHLVPDPTGRVVAIAVRFPVGSGQDPVGSEGTAFLLARVLELVAAERLAQFSVQVEAEVHPDELLFTLVAPPDRWREAFTELEALLYDRTLPAPILEALQSRMSDVLRFEEGSPVREFERERARLLHGSIHPLTRSVLGTAAASGVVGVTELDAFRSLHLRRADGVVAVLGPVSQREFEAVIGSPVRVSDLSAAGRPGGPPGESVSESLLVPIATTGPMAWDEGERIVADRPFTATWIAVAYPFPPGTPTLLLEFIAHLVEEGLNPTPPDPGLYELQVGLEQVDGAPILLVSASVDPRSSSRWADRLENSIGVLSEGPPTGAFFELARRRFRSRMVLELAVPEAQVRQIVRQVAQEGGVRPRLHQDIWQLREGLVSEVALTAGPPRILLFGPSAMMRP